MEVALLTELLSLLKTVNESIGVPDGGDKLSDKNILQGNTPSNPNNRIRPILNSNEKRRTSEIGFLFAKAFFEYNTKNSPDKALATSVGRIDSGVNKQIIEHPKKENKKEGKSLWWKIIPFLGGLVALIAGLMTDGPFKGLLKILAKIGISGGLKIIKHTIKTFFNGIVRTIKLPFEILGKFFSNSSMGKMFGEFIEKIKTPFKTIGKKASGIFKGGFMGKIAAKVFKPLAAIFKKLPLIGNLISIGFAVSRFMKGDVVGGVIDLLSAASGLLYLVPGGQVIAPVLSIGLDVLNAWLDMKAADPKNIGRSKMDILGDMASTVGKWIWERAEWMPLIGGIKRWGHAYEAFKGGNIVEGLRQFGMGMMSFTPMAPIVTGIEMLMGMDSKSKSDKSLTPNTNWYGKLKEWIKSKLQNLPDALRKPLEWFGILDEGKKDTFVADSIGKGEDKIKKWGSEVWDTFGFAFDRIGKGISDTYNKVSPTVGNIWEGVKDGVSATKDMVKDSYVKVLPVVGNIWEGLKGNVSDAKEVVKGFFASVGNIWEGLKGDTKEMVKGYFVTIKDNIGSMFNSYIEFFDKINNFIGDMISKVYDSVNPFSSEKPEVSEGEKNKRAKMAGYDSWQEYEKSGWKWKGKTAEEPKIQQIPPQSISIDTKASSAVLEEVAKKQLKSLNDIHSVAYAILQNMSSMGGGSNVSISMPAKPKSDNFMKVPPTKISDERSGFATSPYAFA